MIRKNTAPGIDGIEYKMIKEMTEKMHEIMLKIYNKIWTTQNIPEDWKKYQIMFIDKTGKEKVRPIALSSCLGKILERLINERLVWWAEKNNKIEKEQNGFRRGKSCLENISKITTDIKNSLNKNEYTLVAYLDVKSAYDNVQHNILLKTLGRLNCPTNITKYVDKWIKSRVTEFIISKNQTETRTIHKGLPQGAVLSPILYTLYTHDIQKNIPEDIKITKFADDIAVYVSSPNRAANKTKIEVAINTINNNLEEIGLELSAKKTVLVEYNKYGIQDKELSIKVKDVVVKNEKEAKFLGIWIDNGLKYRKQIEVVRAKVNKANSIITYLARKTKGMETNTAFMLYKSIVRSITDYASFIYYPNTKSLSIKLERAQFQGVRTALGYRNSTPTNVMIAEAKIHLLRDRANLLARNFLIKASTYGDEQFIEAIGNLERGELFNGFRNPLYTKSMITIAWQRVKWIRKKVGNNRKFEIFKHDYQIITDRIEADFETGLGSKEGNNCEEKLKKK